MSSKTRKLIWSVPIMATLAIVGALAAFVVLGNGAAQAQGSIPPGAPTIHANSAAGNGSINLLWTSPVEPGVPAFDGYLVEYIAVADGTTTAPAADVAGWTPAPGTADLTAASRSLTISGLRNDDATTASNVDYFVRIAATVVETQGEYAVSSVFDPAASKPGAPTDVTVSQTGTAELSVSWTAPENDGGAADGITGYTVTYAIGDTDGTGEVVVADAALTATITGLEGDANDLTADAEVVVSVVAVNGITDGDDQVGESDEFTVAEAPDISILDFTGSIESDSTSGGGSPQFTVTIPDLSTDLPVGSSIVLYLEDDFQEPDSIPASSVYFVADQPRSVATGGGARVYASRASTIETDDYFDPTKNDISIRVFIPNMCTTDTTDCSGADGAESGQRLRMIIEDTSGIKNPTEFGSHSAAFRVLGPADSVPGPTISKDKELLTVAKISLSDNNNTRGYEMTVTATGFNNGTSAGAYVLVEEGVAPSCADVISRGASVGSATVGSDDVASISFEVAAPTFKPGQVNYICVADGEGRRADNDVEQFELEDSIRVVPGAVNAGDTVTVFAQDFTSSLSFSRLLVSGKQVYPALDENNDGIPDYDVDGRFASIGSDGSATGTFVMPASIDGNPVVGIRAVKAYWGSSDAATTITVAPSELSVSKTDVLPNETITITGNGYGTQSCIPIANITLDNVAIEVDDDSQVRCDPDDNGPLDQVDAVEVSNSGQFVATVTLWPADRSQGADNPTLISGSHTFERGGQRGLHRLDHPDHRGTHDVCDSGSGWPA